VTKRILRAAILWGVVCASIVERVLTPVVMRESEEEDQRDV